MSDPSEFTHTQSPAFTEGFELLCYIGFGHGITPVRTYSAPLSKAAWAASGSSVPTSTA
ncbi:hypothetical protein LCGC14_3082580, partial [marine sediment metagenome]